VPGFEAITITDTICFLPLAIKDREYSVASVLDFSKCIRLFSIIFHIASVSF